MIKKNKTLFTALLNGPAVHVEDLFPSLKDRGLHALVKLRVCNLIPSMIKHFD